MPTHPERSLWAAVVAQAIDDATGGGFVATKDGHHSEAWFERVRARAWLTQGSQDFRDVCSLAGLDWAAVRDKALLLKRAGWPPMPRHKNLNIRNAATREAAI